MDTQAALTQQKTQILSSIAFYRGDLDISEKAADPMDQTTTEANREESGREVTRQMASLREVEEALERIANGTYGICTDCDEPISAKRLAARPAAARCINCQEFHDKKKTRRVN